MVVVTPSPSPPDLDIVKLYYTKDTLIGNLPVLIFHGPSTTTNSTQNSSRIQAHIFSIAGFVSYPRLTVAPTSPLYAAVHHLPEDKQGDETCRGLAVSLLKYYTELTKWTRTCLQELVAVGRPDERAPPMFDEMHAASLATRMVPVENAAEIWSHITSALVDKNLSWTDLDVVLPAKSITKIQPPSPLADFEDRIDFIDDGRPLVDFGDFKEIVELLGSPSFLPTSRLRRAPSRPTAVSRTRTLADGQKESLHREMREILETEKNYVSKVHDLTHSIAVEYCRNANSRPYSSVPQSERAMQQLFPPSLQEILKVNNDFMIALRALMDDFEPGERDAKPPDLPWITERDSTGADSFAKVMLAYFPKFREPYKEYMRASAQFPKILNEFLRDSASGLAKALQQTGEQRLRSWLIEPVQRLPRYGLYIDNMVNQLPATHPAMSKFLKARDIITDICSLDDDTPADNDLTIRRLKGLVTKWPDNLQPTGRLITAVDAAEIAAPYRVNQNNKEGVPCILLLFPDHVLVLKKLSRDALSARGLLAEVDRPTGAPSTMSSQTGSPTQHEFLSLSFAFRLDETRFLESNAGRLLSLSNVRKTFTSRHKPDNSTNYVSTTRSYFLLGSYEGKAARWNEEIARARIEQRFPETMRDTDKWGLRIISPQRENLGIVTAIFEDDSRASGNQQRRHHGRIQVVVSGDECPDQDNVPDTTSEIYVRINLIDDGNYRLEFRGLLGHHSTDKVTADDFEAVFLKRLSNLQRLHSQPITLELAQTNISYSQKIAETIRPRFPLQESNSRRRFGPVSPVKALTSFLGGTLRDPGSPSKQRGAVGDLFMNDDHKSILSPPPLLRANSKVTVVAAPDAPATGSVSQLEKTFNTYIVSLHARSGNVVGKVLRNRGAADELKVNELYNTLIEDPSQMQAAAEVSVDVLFSSFEKFLDREWKDRMGPVIPPSLLNRMEKVFDTMVPSKVPEEFRNCLDQLSPQNKRAFSSMIRLLYDLLDASGNDGDRGALVATFAEALVVEGQPLRYIPIFDRLTDDIDILLDDVSPFEATTTRLPSGSLPRGRSAANTDSISSTGSSLRKKFGLGILTRENSKSEHESKVSSVWRTLSNKKSGDKTPESQPSSLSKSFLSRSRSTDNRSGNHDRPGSAGTGTLESRSRPGSAHNAVSSLLSIGENVPQNEVATSTYPRKKRRSSLSDLRDLRLSSTTFGSPTPRFPPQQQSPAPSLQAAREALTTPSPSKMQRQPTDQVTRLPSPSRKENIAPRTAIPRAGSQDIETKLSQASLPRHERNGSEFNSLKHGLRERSSPSNIPTLAPKKTTGGPQKLRIQSPKKLRERLDKERDSMQSNTSGLNDELGKIGDELNALNLSRDGPTSIKSLATRVKALDQKITSLKDDSTQRTSQIQKDIESSLQVSERKCRDLDEKYREANAENEALYERFNSELAKVVGRFKKGEGVAEIQARVEEAQNEAARLRRENQRLKRENLGLRSQLTSD